MHILRDESLAHTCKPRNFEHTIHKVLAMVTVPHESHLCHSHSRYAQVPLPVVFFDPLPSFHLEEVLEHK